MTEVELDSSLSFAWVVRDVGRGGVNGQRERSLVSIGKSGWRRENNQSKIGFYSLALAVRLGRRGLGGMTRNDEERSWGQK